MLLGGGDRDFLRHRLRRRLLGAGAHPARPRHPRRLRSAQIGECQAAQARARAALGRLTLRLRLPRVLPLLGFAAVAYAALVGGLYLFQRQLLYFPDRARPELLGLEKLGVREVILTTEDGLSLLSWYLPARPGRPVIAYFHGNGGHIGYRVERLLRFAREGYGMLMAEYRGYGGNPGAPSETGFYADGRAALAFLDREGVAPSRLVLYGESLGSGVAVALAVQHQVAAVILEAPPTSVAEVAQCHFPFVPAARMVTDRFDSLSRIGMVKAPILVLHGERDR